ncbi:diadenosine tetraphosphate hydrolase, partial [Clavibacter michiganensis subsp. insidiosus]
RSVWLHPAERWHDPATAHGGAHDELRARIRDELRALARDDAVEVRAP